MKSELPMAEWEHARQALKARLVRFILGDEGELDPRSVTILNRNGILKEKKTIDFGPLNRSTLIEKAPREFAGVPAGPLVLKLTRESGEPKGDVIDIADMVLASSRAQRTMVATYLERLGKREDVLSPLSLRSLESYQAALGHSNWEQAALELSDTLRRDFLLNVAGLCQSVVMRYAPAYASHLDRVLLPSIESLESIELRVWTPRESAPEIERVFSEACSQATLQEALGCYYRVCGHLPMGESYSAAALVSQWLEQRGRPEATSAILWQWAEDCQSPLALYHVCEVLLRHPSLMREAEWPRLYDTVSYIASSYRGSIVEPLRLRCALAGHYCRYLESRIPGHSTERIPAFAWWMAERVAGALHSVVRSGVESLREDLEPAIEQTKSVWSLGLRSSSQSALRYATLFSQSVWSDSMMALLRYGKLLLQSSPERANELESALTMKLLGAFPPMRPAEDNEFAFEEGLSATVRVWIDSASEEPLRSRLRQRLALYERLSSADGVAESLAEVPDEDENIQLVVLNALQVSIHLTGEPRKELWERVSSGGWLNSLLQNGDLRGVEVLFRSLRHLQFLSDEWRTGVPHVVATACEELADHEDAERRYFVFVLVAISCIAGDVCSALQRLLVGPTGARFETESARLRENLLELLSVAPPGLSGRLRSVLAVV